MRSGRIRKRRRQPSRNSGSGITGPTSPSTEKHGRGRPSWRSTTEESAPPSAPEPAFNVYFRDSYGSPYLEYELFEGIETYRGLRLRSGGNNAEWLKFKDAFLLDLVRGRRFAQVESRPSVLFLNGEYWGVYLLSEKVSDRMLADHYGVDPNNVILFKEGEMEEGEDGDSVLYDELMACAGKDLSDPAEWEAFCRIMDVASMADYCAARIWFGDADWRPDKNDMLWRTRDGSFNGGRWMYVLYDVEYSSGMYGQEETAAHTDHIRMAEERYPLFAAAMKNSEFRTAFLDALREIGTVCCSPERTDRLLAQYLAVWEPLMTITGASAIPHSCGKTGVGRPRTSFAAAPVTCCPSRKRMTGQGKSDRRKKNAGRSIIFQKRFFFRACGPPSVQAFRKHLTG